MFNIDYERGRAAATGPRTVSQQRSMLVGDLSRVETLGFHLRDECRQGVHVDADAVEPRTQRLE
jgi:hypothetical protein